MSDLQGTLPCWLDPDDPGAGFPDVELALAEPNGLLAIGGDLSEHRLLDAYRHGIFPWYSEGQPILWWSPDPRLVLWPEEIRLSRSLARTLKKKRFEVTFDRDFPAVINACAAWRPGQSGTWITDAMKAAYIALHRAGHAHSVECWRDGKLVGGLYGIAIGRVFFGESMFSRESDASKAALVHLAQRLEKSGFRLIDCQVRTSHLESLGARTIPRGEFTRILAREFAAPAPVPSAWPVNDDSDRQ